MARLEFSVLTPQMFYILVALKKPLYGNQIMEEVRRMTDGTIVIGAGTLYALLPRFLDEHYIQIVEEQGKMKTYQITERGQNKLAKEVQRLEQMVKDYQEVYHVEG